MSRYYEYDYDRNCIIGFGSDTIDTDDISVTSSESGDSMPNSNYSQSQSTISPYASPASSYTDLEAIKECSCDNNYIIAADSLSDKSKLKPLDIYVPFLLVSDMIKLKNKKHKPPKPQLTFGDQCDESNTDTNICINKPKSDNKLSYLSFQRSDDFNGNYYNLFGRRIISGGECHIWKFQILGASPAIIGIIESGATLKTLNCNGAYFGFNNIISAYSFNTINAKTYMSHCKSQQPIYQQMLCSGILDKPMIIDMKLDLINGILSITNQTNGSEHFGKEIILFNKINLNKSYKLAVALLGSETINLF